MSRAATLLLTIAVVSLTTALTVSYTPAVAVPDVTPLYVVGGMAVVLAILVDTDFARTHIPFLKPAFIETQRQLGIVSHEGQRLLGRLNANNPAAEGDEAAKEYWESVVQRWTDWADRIIHWRLPHLRDAFANQAGRDQADYRGTKWQRDLQTWFGVLMLRLNEYTLNADRHQHVLGPEPADADRSIPHWGEPPDRRGS